MFAISDFEHEMSGSGFVLRINHFRLGKGEIVYLRGPSGSGKTTLLKLLAGVFQSPLGEQCRQEFPRIGYVMHEPTLLPWLTVRKNVSIEASLRDWAGDPALFVSLCASFRLDDEILKLRALRLSLGMRQRVEIARALSFSPDLLVLDEAMSGVDAATKLVVMDCLWKCVQAKQMTILATAHQVDDILRLAERVCYVENGVVEGETTFNAPVESRLCLPLADLFRMKETLDLVSC
jgi:ABC-type multidrug transport system ATPase subunit